MDQDYDSRECQSIERLGGQHASCAYGCPYGDHQQPPFDKPFRTPVIGSERQLDDAMVSLLLPGTTKMLTASQRQALVTTSYYDRLALATLEDLEMKR